MSRPQLPFPHVLVAALCAGLGVANLVRLREAGLLAAAAGAAAVVARERARLPLLVAAVLLAGTWWGSIRLDALDRSILVPRVGGTARVLLLEFHHAGRGHLMPGHDE